MRRRLRGFIKTTKTQMEAQKRRVITECDALCAENARLREALADVCKAGQALKENGLGIYVGDDENGARSYVYTISGREVEAFYSALYRATVELDALRLAVERTEKEEE